MVVADPPDAAALDRPWVRSYPPGVPPEYHLPAVAVTRFLDDAVRDFPRRDALVTPKETVDYATLAGRVDDVAEVLADAGIEAGARVLVALPNHAATPVALFALWRLAAVVVPVDPSSPPELLAAVAHDAGVGAVLGTGHVLSTLRAKDLAATTWLQVDGAGWRAYGTWTGSGPVRVLAARRGMGWPGPSRFARAREHPSAPHGDGDDRRSGHAPLQLAEALHPDSQQREPGLSTPAPRDAQPDDAAVILYDTADPDPHGIVYSHANLVASAFQARLWIPDIQAGRERVLIADRFHDLTALSLGLLTAVLAAGTILLADEPDVAALARAIERGRPTLLTTRSHRLESIVTDRDGARRDLTSLRVVLACGPPVHRELVVGFERLTDGARLRGCFGVAGAGPITHAQPVYGRVDPGSLGLPVTSTVAAVVDPRDLATLRQPGVPGVLLLSGPQVASGLRPRDATGAARLVGDWLVTDDLVTVDDDGTFRYVGRRHEVIERTGVVISPRQVEAVLEYHTGVRQAAVVLSPDGALLLAAVVTRRRSRPEPHALLEYCRAHLDSPAVPDRVIVVPSLPSTEAGELDSDELSRDLASRLS